MQYKITIPEPCRQNWDTMLPNDTGRYCSSCEKSVIDFTSKTDEEIQQFIINNLNQSLCGRFKNTQIQRIIIDLPQNIFSIKMPLWMRFLVACLLIFGISIFPFETTIAGKTPAATAFYQGEPIQLDTAKTPRISRKKKKRKSKYKISFAGLTLSSIPLQDVVYGGMGVERYPILKSIFDLPVKDYATCNIRSVSTEANPHNNSLPQKKLPVPTPYMPTEFILPSILLFRKENNNQSMD